MSEAKYVVNNTENSKKTLISNYDNVKLFESEEGTTGIVYSPKNKRYTLSIGILNSQNEFQDITNTLCRWENKNNKSQIINTYSENPSDLYKFNRGYFIATKEPEGLEETIEDSKLIKKRQVIPANTYAYKLVGPMYLKVDYNHISRFSYSITGTKVSDGVANLTITGYITYNCPDTENPTEEGKNSQYYTFEENVVSDTLSGFDFFKYTNGAAGAVGVTPNIYYDKCKYNEQNNTYTVIIKKQYTGITANRDNHYLDYVIAVGEPNLYLRGLTETGTIDFNLLGSGQVALDNWRFQVPDFNSHQLELRFSLDAYPKENREFRNLKIQFGNNQHIIESGFSTGVQRILFENVDMQKFYIAEISYEIYDTQTGNPITSDDPDASEDSENPHIIHYAGSSPSITYKDQTKYWILTTQLFNSCFMEGSSEFIKNYANPQGNEVNILSNKQKITPKYKISFTDNSGNIKLSTSGTLLNTSNSDAEVCYTQSRDVDVDVSVSLEVENKLLYPDYLEWIDNYSGSSLSFSSVTTNVGNTSSNSGINEKIHNQNENAGKTQISNKTHASYNSISNSNGKIKGTLSWNDWYWAHTKRFDGTIYNGFDKLSNYLTKIKQNKNIYVTHSGFALDGDNRTNRPDIHWIYFVKNYPREYVEYTRNHDGDHDTEYSYYTEIKSWTANNATDEGMHGETSDNARIYNLTIGHTGNTPFDYSEFLNDDNSRALFAYLYWNPVDSNKTEYNWFTTGWGNHWDSDDSDEVRRQRNPVTWSADRAKSAYRKSRFMWKNKDNNWTYIDGFFPEFPITNAKDVFDQFAELFNGVTTNNIYICRYKELDCSSSGYNLFIINKSGDQISEVYNYPFVLSIKPNISGFVVDNSGNSILRFTGEEAKEYKNIELFNITNNTSGLRDVIDQFQTSELHNIDINTGTPNLNFGTVYVNDGQFKAWGNSPIQMVKVDNSDIEYELRCNPSSDIRTSLSEYYIDEYARQGESSDGWTFLKYDYVYKISLDKFKYNGTV